MRPSPPPLAVYSCHSRVFWDVEVVISFCKWHPSPDSLTTSTFSFFHPLSGHSNYNELVQSPSLLIDQPMNQFGNVLSISGKQELVLG